MTILAIDPGITGAYSLLGAAAQVDDLPVHQAQHDRGAKVRGELDLHSFRTLLAGQPIGHCFIERVAARPEQGLSGTNTSACRRAGGTRTSNRSRDRYQRGRAP